MMMLKMINPMTSIPVKFLTKNISQTLTRAKVVTGGETKEEQGLTREEMIEQEKLRKEALLQVMFTTYPITLPFM